MRRCSHFCRCAPATRRPPNLFEHVRIRQCINLLNFDKIEQTVAEICPIFDFSWWRPSAILDLFAVFLGHWGSIFGGHYWCAQFGSNPCSIVLIMWNFEYFAHLAWKCQFTYPKLRFWGMLLLNVEVYQQHPQKSEHQWRMVFRIRLSAAMSTLFLPCYRCNRYTGSVKSVWRKPNISGSRRQTSSSGPVASVRTCGHRCMQCSANLSLTEDV